MARKETRLPFLSKTILFLVLTHLKSIFCFIDADSEEVNFQNVGTIIETQKFSLVLFFAKWDEACSNKVSIFRQLQYEFHYRTDLYIGLIDIYTYPKIARKYRVEDYCVIKYFVKGSNVPERWETALIFPKFLEQLFCRTPVHTKAEAYLESSNIYNGAFLWK